MAEQNQNKSCNMSSILDHVKTYEEHTYTSTGIKFWRHRKQLESYRKGEGYTVVSTHISPEGACNLRCPYCSVSKRKQFQRIEMDVIKDYVLKLKSRGLQAVILTGGGEPTLYPHFNELVEWLKVTQGLSVALITNGTNIDKVSPEVWDMFSWVRVSLNFIDNYQMKIKFPKIKGVLGASMVYIGQTLDELRALSRFVPQDRVQYVRVLPNCLLKQEDLIKEHEKIQSLLMQLSDKRFFQQYKLHGMPCSSVCHQAYFRPYLSELDGGTVFPCDSLVLNEEQMHFSHRYAICKAEDVLDFIDHKINMDFDAKQLCSGCVFTDNIKLLDDWYVEGKNKFDEYTEELIHEEFV